MDEHIKKMAYLDKDLIISEEMGFACQADLTQLIDYDDEYVEYYEDCKGSDIAIEINDGRVELVDSYTEELVLDVGIGSGEFIESRSYTTYGYDVNPKAIKWLRNKGIFTEDFESFSAFTFWDVIEHIPDPGVIFSRIKTDSYLFTSIPLFKDITRVKESKHYKPGEHLYYWTREGFIYWMNQHGFLCLHSADFEIEAGREEIYSFVFKKCFT